MNWDGKTVTAEKAKGKIVLFTSEEDQLMHFQWQSREKSEVPIDLIFFENAYFTKVAKCKTGRVYLLRFEDKKQFFWMQEPQEDGDAELIKKFNDAVGMKIPEPTTGGTAAAAAPAGAAPTAAAAAAAPAGQTPAIDPALQQVLTQFLAQQAQGGQAAARQRPVPLEAVLTTEVLTSLLADETACKEMADLLPPGQQSPEDLREALVSPQLRQHLHSLTQAIHSDQLPVLFSSLGLDPSSIATAAPGSDALELLCRAMENQQK
jgi:hypothetical protein